MDEQQVQNSGESMQKAPQKEVKKQPAMKPKKVFSMKFIIVILALVIAALGTVLYMSSMKTDTDDMMGDEAMKADNTYPDVVAIVNGEELSNEEFTKHIAQVEQSAAQQGLDPQDPTVHSQVESEAMTILINTKLLTQAAMKEGIAVLEEQVNEQIALIEAQFGGKEALQTQMDTLGVTEEILRTDIAEQLAIETYIKGSPAFADITVTDEDISSAYDTFSEQNPELPPLEEISSQIKEQLIAQKQQALTGELIGKLRTEAVIEVKIESIVL